jgi:glycosyltransferase involved in cell wall biosynthesis
VVNLLRFDDVTAVIVTRGDLDMSWTKDLPYGEVIVWDNSVERDAKVLGRYRGAERATRDVIYFQDDDVRFHEHEALLESYEPGVLVSNMYDQWIQDCGYQDLALVGLGSICDKGLWREPLSHYLLWCGREPRFELDCDFIFGTLCRWRRIDFGHEILDVASDDSRLWKQPGQLEGKWETIDKARRLRQVVLAMIVKDEEANIERAIKSARGWYDRILVIDTGSTDLTKEIAADLGAEVLERPWVSMGHNRNELLEEARKRADYTLMMDADEELVWNPYGDTGRPIPLHADAYILHYDGPIDFAQPRLLYRNFPWRFDDVPVHAALDAPEGRLPVGVNLQSPVIVHHGWDRAGAHERIERQLEELTKLIDDGVDVPRHLFLRAKAWEALDKDRAITDYTARVKLSSGDEEAYYSRFRLGVLTAEHLNDFPKAAETLVEAWKERPTRNEALRALAFYATALSDATPYPEDDQLLVHRDLYERPNL